MKTVLVTGAAGFMGKHLVEALGRNKEVQVISYDQASRRNVLEHGLAAADVVFHLAGVNRPQNVDEFNTGNAGFTKEICDRLQTRTRQPVFVLSSSIQAELDNPYGSSKRAAEDAVKEWARRSGGRACIFRLKNVFGKWCRPNYNSVTATFCHNIAHGLPITISDPARHLELVYIDDVITEFLKVLETEPGETAPRSAGNPSSPLPLPAAGSCEYRQIPRSFNVTLGDLAARIRSFRESRTSLLTPSLQNEFTRCLYATYLSYLDANDFGYRLDIKADNRGELAEFMKSAHFGQIFVSRTKPGVTRGNHYHHTKTEKFLVLEGEAVIRFRSIQPDSVDNPENKPGEEPRVIEHRVSGKDFRVLDIPPGYTHSIENIGDSEMVVLFWASEIFDPVRPDTYFSPVI